MIRQKLILALALGLSFGVTSSAFAQAEGEAPPPPPPPSSDDAVVEGGESTDDLGTGLVNDEQVLTEEQLGVEAAHDSTDPYEDPHRTYMFLGSFYRHTWLPQFMLNLFTDEAVGTDNPSVGLEFIYRKDGMDIITSLYWMRSHAYGPFLGPGDEPSEVEIIDSSLSAIMVGATFLWSTAFNDIVAFQYGIGLGIGGVYGDLVRTEAYPDDDNSMDGSAGGFAPCAGPSDPNGGAFCDPTSVRDGESGGHYGIKAHRWHQGGSVPFMWFRAAPQIALRVKPIRQLMFRVDAGFDLFSGFFVGGSVDVGF